MTAVYMCTDAALRFVGVDWTIGSGGGEKGSRGSSRQGLNNPADSPTSSLPQTAYRSLLSPIYTYPHRRRRRLCSLRRCEQSPATETPSEGLVLIYYSLTDPPVCPPSLHRNHISFSPSLSSLTLLMSFSPDSSAFWSVSVGAGIHLRKQLKKNKTGPATCSASSLCASRAFGHSGRANPRSDRVTRKIKDRKAKKKGEGGTGVPLIAARDEGPPLCVSSTTRRGRIL